MADKKAIIIGAGPAGLTAAYELLRQTGIKPVIYEAEERVGGIARTIEYKGNRMDIGGHRLFSQDGGIEKWWTDFLPLQGSPSRDQIILSTKTGLSSGKNAPDPEKTDKVMLMRRRFSRIFFLRKFFSYPLSEHFDTFMKLGFMRTMTIFISYLAAHLFPIKKEKNLEDFFINRFGYVLYTIFFKKYTQKVWGVSCREISPEWGQQRIRTLNIKVILRNSVKHSLGKLGFKFDGKKTEASLIEKFLYPKLGIGQLWDEVADAVKKKGGKIYCGKRVVGLIYAGKKVTGLRVRDELTGETTTEEGDYFISTMPVKDMIRCMGRDVPDGVREVAEGLRYRDFILVGLLLKDIKIKNNTGVKTVNNILPDNWIYVQERDIHIGRIQIYNNWSPYMVKEMNTVLLGLEYFCNEGDLFWSKTDKEIIRHGVAEIDKMGLADRDSVLDGTVIRITKTYPAYFGSYGKFDIIKDFTDGFENLFLVGRNGMHRYNNLDHSMLTAMAAVDNIKNGRRTKENIWNINV